MVIDAWMQHGTVRFLQHEMLDSLWRWTGQKPPEQEVPVGVTVGAMDAGGVDVGLISAWYGPEGALVGNDEVASFVEQAAPGRLLGIASVDIRKPMDAVRELRRCVRELGFRGLRVVPWLWEVPPTDRRLYPLYAECIELGIPFCTQVGHTGPLRPSEGGRHKVMFGTNYPMISPEQALKGLDDLGISGEAKEAFLSGNAKHVFHL